MDKAILENLTPEQRGKMAVAYLMRNKDERPEELRKFFDKLDVYEKSAAATNVAISRASEAVTQLQTKFYSLLGSIDTITDLIADGLENITEDEIMKWCEKYQPPDMIPNIPRGVDMSGHPNIPAGNIDMAGKTTHQQ